MLDAKTRNDEVRKLAQHVAQARPTPRQVAISQAYVYEKTLQLSSCLDSENFTRVNRDDLMRLALLIDEQHFEGRLLPLARAEGFEMGLSSRMTKTAGKTVTTWKRHDRSQRSFSIIISSTLLFQTFRDVDRQVTVTGLACENRLQALQRVMEHELTHLLEMVVWNTSACSQGRFQGIAGRLFGHRDFKHNLITQAERAARMYDIRVGQQVEFVHDGLRRIGTVNRITRRATILVPDGQGQLFSDGKRYLRFYVPLQCLRRA